ncbi:MAG: DUF881 domain-containing protein [Nocardioides sp.]
MPEVDARQEGLEDAAPGGETSGRERLKRALLTPSREQLVVAVLMAALGFAAVTQVRATETDNTYAGYREQDLIDVLNGMADADQRARSELARLEQNRRDLQTRRDSRSVALAQAQQAATVLEILSGQVPVTGPGVRITVTEATGTVDVDSILDTVESLRSAGAEAIEFNDSVRLVAQSPFEDGVGGLLVDGTLVTSPFVIDVVGDPTGLRGALTFPTGPVQQLKQNGAEVEIEELDSVDIESTHSYRRPEYAQPDGEQ